MIVTTGWPASHRPPGRATPGANTGRSLGQSAIHRFFDPGMAPDWFSPAQCFGYLAFVLGVGSFLQANDRRFKFFMIGECLAYVVHFALLGNPTAVASSFLSTVRSVLALRTRSVGVAAAVVAANLAFGLGVAERPSDWLPLAASCVGTVALFLLQGIRMRLLMLCGTGLWIANNLIVGSIGGTALELVVAAVNATTIVRLWRRGRGVDTARQA
jgi:hypothetical protein